MNRLTKTTLAVAISLGSTTAAAQFQMVMGMPQLQDVPVGGEISVSANYMALPAGGTTGLGLQMFWNSGALELIGLTNILDEQLLAAGEPELDMDNLDNDLDTDMVVHVAWADWLKSWPADGGVVTLLEANFENIMEVGEMSRVNFLAPHTPIGYAFVGHSAVVNSVAAVSDLGECAPGVWCDEFDQDDDIEILWAGEHPWDVDGDGQINALTDGIYIVRYMFGFRGEALTEALK